MSDRTEKLSVDDIYARAEWLCESLQSRGQMRPAEEVQTAIAAGATGTEVVMALRWHLEQLRAGDVFKGEETTVVDEIVASIRQLLKF